MPLPDCQTCGWLGGGTEVPYQVVVERGRQQRQSFATSIRDLGHIPGQYSSFVVDLGRNGTLHNEIEILTDSRSFQRAVTVEGSTAAAWSVLQQESRIFDFTPREGTSPAAIPGSDTPKALRATCGCAL